MRTRVVTLLAAFVLGSGGYALSQGLSSPPSGDNQRSTVTQQVGPVKVSIEYSSPRVTRGKNDRRGQIWGKLVPYGLTQLDFNDCKSCPWRAGANENTTFTVSHDVKVQGQPLPAGAYGLHMIAGPEEWTVLFSKNATSWGSYWYDPKEDALRVPTKSTKSEYHEWLTYEFTEREPEKATVALKWEELQVPFTITVENAPALWVAKMREELRGNVGFDWRNFRQAAEYSIQNKVNLPEALTWAERATTPAFGGEENFQTLYTLSRAQAANGRTADAQRTVEKAVNHPNAQAVQIHQAGRQLLAEGKKEEGMKIFQLNAKRFPNQWPVHVGLARGHAAMGDNKKAIEEAKLALPQAPNEGNKKNLENIIKQLEDGKKID
jgi:hypothetical protein